MVALIPTPISWLVILLIALAIIFVVLSTKWLVRSSNNVYNGLDELKSNCLNIKTTEDYNQCYDHFKQLQRKSFHRHHSMALYEIYGILESKHHDYVNSNAENA